ncbi:PcfB family protein [Bengtsoniella intestinalis]|uniref:PcfB family protein n=1 Tax=Bengtsoniella intestinalis TaxID=3073143 RepID=UPI00391FBF37
MTTGGGEAADQMVRMMLTGSEVTIRLGASALKNLIALSVALAKQNKTLHGKVNMAKILRQTRDIRVFPMDAQQYKQFQRQAKGQKILYSAIKDKATGAVDLVMPVTELDRANHIFNRIQYHDVKDNPLVQEEPTAPTHQRSNPERDETFTQGRPEGEHPPSPDSADTRVNLNTSTKDKAAQRTQTTHEYPSIVSRLRAIRERQAREKRKAPQKLPTKAKPKDR